MRIKIAGTLTAAQRAAVNRAKAYHGKQPHTEFFADCVIWYKNDWAVVIPISHAVPYYWAAGSNTLLTGLASSMATDPFRSTVNTQYNAGTFGDATIVTTTEYQAGVPTPPDPVPNNWPVDVGARIHIEASRPSGDYIDYVGFGSWFTDGSVSAAQGATFTEAELIATGVSRGATPKWQTLSGTAILGSSGPAFLSPMPTQTAAYTPFSPSYETLADDAAWNALVLAQHTAVIDTFKNATPPTISTSPAASVTVTVGATSALAHASISASPTGLSSATYDNFGNANLIIVTVPMTLTLVPDISGASDEVINVDFYRDGVLIASEGSDPFTHEIVISATESASYSAIYTDASDEVDTAPLTVTGLLSRVDFYRGTTLLASDVSPPYSCTDPSLAAGEYVYSATVYNDAGATSAGALTVSAVGPALTGDALSAITTVVPVTARPIDAEHAYARPYFDGTFWKRGGVAYLFPLNPTAGGEERGMYYDQRLDDDLTELKIEGYARLRCGDAADLTAPITIIDWVPVSAATLPIDGPFPMYVVRVADATNYGEYPVFGWWYDETEQIQKADMALDPAPTWQIALFNFVRDTMS